MYSKRIYYSLTALLFSITLVACGGNSDQEPEATEQSKQQTMSQAAPTEKINLNTGSEDDFLAIPGVGDNMVHEFEEYRPYVSIQQFRSEIGKYVDSAQVAAYEQYVFVPINPNECDATTLQQIPGLDASEADQLINVRPFDSHDAFLQQLAEFVNEEQLATAKRYLAAE